MNDLDNLNNLWKAWNQTAKTFETCFKAMLENAVNPSNLIEVQQKLTEALQKASEAGIELSKDVINAFKK